MINIMLLNLLFFEDDKIDIVGDNIEIITIMMAPMILMMMTISR